MKENSNFLSGPFEDDPLDFDGASLGGASFADSLGCAVDGPVTWQKQLNILLSSCLQQTTNVL